MIIIKVERSGGLWTYKEFDTVYAAAIFLIQEPTVKLRLAGEATDEVKSAIIAEKDKIIERKNR